MRTTPPSIPGALRRVMAVSFFLGCALLLAGCASAPPMTAHVKRGPAALPGDSQESVKIGALDDPSRLFDRRPPELKAVTVTATAFISRPGKSKRQMRGAWGDKIEPGMNVVAVSQDLLDLGLNYRDVITIEGVDGDFVVLDMMHPRLRKTIDIYFGADAAAARRWGRRTINISFD